MSGSWPDRARWNAMRAGARCPMCDPIADMDEHGFTVARLAGSVLRLARNQFSAGYCVLICTEHAPEPYSLPDPSAYLGEMSRCGAALERAFGADKMNFLILGNAVPHLHTHLIPRYVGDPAPGAPYLPEHTAPVELTEVEYADRVARIRAVLDAGAQLRP